MNPQNKPDAPSGDRTDFNPGETISPRLTPATPDSTEHPDAQHEDGPKHEADHAAKPAEPEAPAKPEAAVEPEEPKPVSDHAEATAEPETSPEPAKVDAGSVTQDEPAEKSFYHADESDTVAAPPAASPLGATPPRPVRDEHPVSWTAAEFIDHSKSQSWYMGLAGVAFVVALLMYIITRDIISTVMVVFGAVVFGISASRPPRELHYTMDSHGLTIGNKSYPFAIFRSFGVIEDATTSSITFMPLKRFAPPISVHVGLDDEKQIVDILANHLPMQEHVSDPVDKLMRHIRF